MSLLNRRILMMNNMEDEEDMGSWELIREITINETAKNISIAEDDNGNSFSLKEIEVLVISKPTELTKDAAIRVCMTSSFTYSTIIGIAARSTDNVRYCYGYWKRTGIGIVHQQSRQSVNGTSVSNNMSINTNLQVNINDNGTFSPDICEGLWIGDPHENVLSPGTIIRVYGIRE